MIQVKKIILATRNRHKLSEIREILNDLGIEILGLDEFPDAPKVIEDGATFEENAIKKAVEIFNHTGIPTIADDSGLEVDALNGAPGVLSARYAGEGASYEDNNRKLLKALDGISLEKRTAKFKCVIAYVDDVHRKIFEGVTRGKIIFEMRGKNGFGYDPLFLPDGFNLTYAEMTPEMKNKISHRAKALEKLKRFLKELK